MKIIHSRWSLFTVIMILLSGLVWYAGNHPPWIDLKDCVRDPGQYDGKQVTYIREPRVDSLTEDGFILKYGSGKIRVKADFIPAGFKAGEYIGMTAIYHKDGTLTAEKLIIARNRRYKIWLSVIPVLTVAVLFFRFFRWNRSKFQWEMRHA